MWFLVRDDGDNDECGFCYKWVFGIEKFFRGDFGEGWKRWFGS